MNLPKRLPIFLIFYRFKDSSEFATVYHNDKDMHALPTSLSIMANAISKKARANVDIKVTFCLTSYCPKKAHTRYACIENVKAKAGSEIDSNFTP